MKRLFFKYYSKPFALIFISYLFSLLACSGEPSPAVNPAFYHWKNTLQLSPFEFDRLAKLKTRRVYLRFFDIDWQGNQATPISVLEKRTDLPDSIAIVPTVFITNRTMLNISKQQIPELADKVIAKIQQLSTSFDQPIPEVQFDCDWSLNSKEAYFQFLEILKSKLHPQGQKISTTIRLHQIKYSKKTGIPPVDRGVLMFYNMDDINSPATKNSILNISLARQYLDNFQDYSLPLDIALPIFKWGLIFQDKKLIRIINNLDIKDLEDTSRFIKIEENRFELIKSTYLKGYYLYQKDQIKLEQVEVTQLQKAADLLSELNVNKELNLIFYHLDSIQIADYSHEVLEDICHRFY